MPKIARAHHFVPQFLLAGFTPSGSKNDRLWTFDRHTGKQWRTTPENVANRKDYYRVNLAGVAPDAIEIALNKMESDASNVIREILRIRAIPDGNDYLTLINFIALMSVRVPIGREMINRGVDTIYKLLLKAALRTPETWKAQLDQARSAGVDIDEEAVSYQSMRSSLEVEKYTFVADQNWQIKTMLELMWKLVPSLIPRKWCLAISDSGSFVCSDRPVIVRFTQPKPAIASPGLMLKDTEVTFPLSRHVLLIGSWAPFKNETMPLTRKNVAFYNSITIKRCQRFLFSSAKDFCWLDNERKVRYDLIHL